MRNSYVLAALITPFAVALSISQGNNQHQSRSVPSSQYFDLTAPSADAWRSKPLADVTVQQGFAFDQLNARLFVSQRRDGSDSTAGDLTITELDFSGNILGHMSLLGFGHGVAFGAEGVGANTYLWTEVDVASSGYGHKLGRFVYKDGKTLDASDVTENFKPFPDATAITAVVNSLDNTLVVRYNQGGQHIASFDLAAASTGDFTSPLVNFAQPTLSGKSDVFQGYAAYGQYVYAMTGTSYDDSGNVLNSDVWSIDLNTGKVFEGPVVTKAGSTLSFREPEGMGVYDYKGEPRLFLGFASGKAGDRRCNLFYKNVLE